jgi:hypothetical protein
MTVEEVLEALENSREKFLEAIEGLSDEEMEAPGVVDDSSVKDLMSHQISWEAELVKLLWQARQGQKPTTAHFGKQTDAELEAHWLAETRGRSLERIMADYKAVRRQTARRVEEFTDRELNDLQRFPWLNQKPLWQWIATDSYEHEEEQIAEILAWRQKRAGG